jgi:hypothetical protein
MEDKKLTIYDANGTYIILPNGYKIRRMSSHGLTDESDGFKTKKIEWHTYLPNSDIPYDVFATRKEAIADANYWASLKK